MYLFSYWLFNMCSYCGIYKREWGDMIDSLIIFKLD